MHLYPTIVLEMTAKGRQTRAYAKYYGISEDVAYMNTFYTIRRQMLIIQGTKLDIFLPLQYDVGVQFQQRDKRDLV